MKKLLCLSFLLIGCQEQFPVLPYQNPELMPVVGIVLHEGEVRGKYYSVDHIGFDYKPLKFPVIAQCEKGLDRNIFVDPTYWMYNDEKREQVMAHELGHCLLNKDHDDRYLTDHHASVMSTYLFSSWEFYSYRDYFYDELFN